MANDNVEILLIEDNPNDAELTKRALQKHKLTNRLIHIKDGEEAEEFLFCKGKYNDRKMEVQPKLILLDLKLPKVDGLEILRMIRNNDKTKFIPVVVLTSSNEEKDMVESYKLGVNSYIEKPVEFDKFIKAVSDVGYYWLLLNRSLY
jgi:CheY-like chemotaxis protein